MSLEDRWRAQLEALHRQGRYRQLTPPRGIDFSSNDYLGYGKLLAQGADDLSRSGQAARLLRGHHEIWDEVERRLAAWHGAEAALMMTSGYVANEGLLSTVIEPHDWVASDEFNHASIIDGLRLTKAERFIFRHNDLAHLEEGLRQARAHAGAERELFVVTESLHGMEGDESPVEMADVLRVYAASWIVDEAHATGCHGPRGSGLVDAQGLRSTTLATVHTGGKALGVPGAYICCSKLLREYLINRCRHFIFTTALPPLVGQWWLEALDRVQKDDRGRAALQRNAEVFRRALRRYGIEALGRYYIVPIVLGEDAVAVRAAQRLQEEGFDVRAIRPPTVPPGTARLRISIHADHDPATLESLAQAVARVIRS